MKASEVTHGIDGTDEEKAKWWEEDRRVFHGQADTFVARVHFVQGKIAKLLTTIFKL